MPGLSRRRLLFGAAAVAGAAAASPSIAAADPAGPHPIAELHPENPGFAGLAQRGYNPRFVAHPEAIFVPTNTEETMLAVQQALDRGLRIAARSGGHCVEDFVDNPDTRAIIDLSRLDGIDYDPAYQAFSVGSGADLGTVYEQRHCHVKQSSADCGRSVLRNLLLVCDS